MTLFVDCSGSEFVLAEPNRKIEYEVDLFKSDHDIFNEFFRNHKFSACIFKKLNNLADGFIIFRRVAESVLVHIRCTGQQKSVRSAFAKLNEHDIHVNTISIIPAIFAKVKAKRILELMGADCSAVELQYVSWKRLKEHIIMMDASLCLTKFKFGIAYLDRFNTSERQMLCNAPEDTSDEFNEFISKMGSKVFLPGWKKFAGGLDVSDERLTGDFALFRTEEGNEAVFHVTPWLPSGSDNQLERKRHFGNDTIVIIYSESLYSFELKTLLSHQIQIILFVRFISRIRKYQVHIYSRRDIRLSLESNPFNIDKNDNFSGLFRLMIELERECYRSHPLFDKLRHMREYYINDFLKKY